MQKQPDHFKHAGGAADKQEPKNCLLCHHFIRFLLFVLNYAVSVPALCSHQTKSLVLLTLCAEAEGNIR